MHFINNFFSLHKFKIQKFKYLILLLKIVSLYNILNVYVIIHKHITLLNQYTFLNYYIIQLKLDIAMIDNNL